MVSEETIARLVYLLKSTNRHVIGNSVLALLKLALNDVNKKRITKLGGIDVLIPLLLNEKGCMEISPDTACVLMNLSTNAENRELIVEKGGIEYLLPLVSSNDPNSRNFAVCALSILLESETVQKFMIRNDPFDSLFDFLIFTDNLEAQSHLAHALISMKEQHYFLCEKIEKFRIIQILICLLYTSPSPRDA
eukprot:TRINITY_DN4433_c0_g1_i1.p1 TRINITY_DN4433_c0_g1~~TRINITY_DN4433_c0_g1_i1.p1  ORF type:complete len:206 (-),score=28.48 TRINITY_DN4433_c0_g1_i1:22-597(-)